MSDASVLPKQSTAAWVISTPEGFGKDLYIWGTSVLPETDNDSHRAECYGILGGLMTWKKYKQLWEIQT
jgi:hypothetical protein